MCVHYAHTLLEKGAFDRCGGRDFSYLQLQRMRLVSPKVVKRIAQNKNVKNRAPMGQGK